MTYEELLKKYIETLNLDNDELEEFKNAFRAMFKGSEL